MNKIILCFSGRCSHWGKSWKNHIWTMKIKLDDDEARQTEVQKSDNCFRCGMSKKEARND